MFNLRPMQTQQKHRAKAYTCFLNFKSGLMGEATNNLFALSSKTLGNQHLRAVKLQDPLSLTCQIVYVRLYCSSNERPIKKSPFVCERKWTEMATTGYCIFMQLSLAPTNIYWLYCRWPKIYPHRNNLVKFAGLFLMRQRTRP